MKEIINLINSISGKYSNLLIFDDWVRVLALSISNSTELANCKIFQEREKDYFSIMKKYTEKEVTIFAKMFAKLIELFQKEINDYLGNIYMQCEMGNKRTGQFFTPFNLSGLCSEIIIDENDIKNNQVITLYEPSCGAGGMILAYAKVLKDKGVNYQRKIKAIAQDLDYRAVYMTYIQLSLCGIKAKVQQGDSLLNTEILEARRIFYTPAYKGIFI